MTCSCLHDKLSMRGRRSRRSTRIGPTSRRTFTESSSAALLRPAPCTDANRFASTDFFAAARAPHGASHAADHGRRSTRPTHRNLYRRSSRSLQRLLRAGTHIIQLALRALWLSGHADGPTVRDQPMREHGPLLLRDELHEVLLDLHRIEMRGEAQAAGDARDMSVDYHADRDVERISQNDVGCLAS